MTADVVLLPSQFDAHRHNQTVIVFDVLRATTSMTAALAAGVKAIRIYSDIESARSAALAYDGARLLCGETACLPPPGFDLGNSPGQFTASHGGRTLFMSTTNGTRAIIAAQQAQTVLIGSLVNASAVAAYAARLAQPITLLCAGTNGQVAMEDLIGCGAVLDALQRAGYAPASDVAKIAHHLFNGTRADLGETLSQTQGGLNVIHAGLAEDVTFAARLNSIDVVGVVRNDPLRVVSA